MITNDGEIGFVELGNGNVDIGQPWISYVENHETGIIRSVWGSNASDAVINSGRIGYTPLNGGDDTYEGGANMDIVEGGGGNDNIVLGAGNDTFNASGGIDGDDWIEGGKGNNSFNAARALTTVIVDLEAEMASGKSIGSDAILNFENAFGTNLKDFLFGTDDTNVLDGGAGNDFLLGRDGDDYVKGGAGLDRNSGGLGHDRLVGGTEADTFIYKRASESTVAASGGDTIFDFKQGLDKIDLSAIDAATNVAGNQAFTFINSGLFSCSAGELRAGLIINYTVVSGDVNGDRIADMAIVLKGAPSITAVDFVL